MLFRTFYSSVNPKEKKVSYHTNIMYHDHFQHQNVTLKTGILAAENSAFALTEINDILKYIKIENSYFKSDICWAWCAQETSFKSIK